MTKDVETAIQKKLVQDHVVQLQQFLKPEFAQRLHKEIKKLKFLREEKLMSHAYSYSTDKDVLQSIMQELLPYLPSIIPIKSLDVSIVKLTHKDHILIHEKKEKIFVLDLTAQWNDECKGTIGFTNGKGSTTMIPTTFNSLTVSNGQLHFFINYVNNLAKKDAKYLIIGRFV